MSTSTWSSSTSTSTSKWYSSSTRVLYKCQVLHLW